MRRAVPFIVCLLVGCVTYQPNVLGPADTSEDADATDAGGTDLQAPDDMADISGDQGADLGPPSDLPRFPSIALAERTACVVERLTHRVFCWGANVARLLDDAAEVDKYPPFERGEFPPFELLVAGRRHMCGLADGSVYCWGDNLQRQSNTSQNDNVVAPDTPVVQNVEITDLSAGDVHSCAVDDRGGTRCWGANLNGMIEPSASFPACIDERDCTNRSCFRGLCTDRMSPTRVATGLIGRQVAVGDEHTCLLADDRDVHCWGENGDGRAVPGSGDALVTTPTDTELGQFATIAARGFTCGLTADGVRCWGDSAMAQLGAQPGNPVPGTTGAIDVAVGAAHACALLASGTVTCWGAWIADETGIAEFRPPAGEKFLSIGAGRLVTCASTASDLYCWGENGDRNGSDGIVGQFNADQVVDETFDTPQRVPID